MDVNTSDVTSKLKFIGMIQKGEKINVRNMCVQQDTFLTRLIRTFVTLDNRTNAYNFIEGIIIRSFEIITLSLSKDVIKSIDKRLVRNIIQDLTRSMTGIKNIRETYSSDIMFCCKLDSLTEMIESRLKDIDENYGVDLKSDL
jgi:hypothetical protein